MHDDRLAVAIRAVSNAGKYLKGRFLKPHTQLAKKDSTTLLGEDIKSEEILISTIAKAFPSDTFFSEERETFSPSEHVWIIDPLCGTYSYLRGVETWSISVALRINNVSTLSVIYQPFEDTLFHSQASSGAFMKNKRIQTSKVSRIKDAFVSLEHAVFTSGKVDTLNLISHIKRVRVGHGSGGELAYVAAGFLDAVIKTDQTIEHFAGGRALIECAGGTFVDFSGNTPPTFLDKDKRIDYIGCANKVLANKLLDFVAAQ